MCRLWSNNKGSLNFGRSTLFNLFLYCLTASIASVSSADNSDELQLVIREFLAVNEQGMRDEDGDFSDWIEIYNTSDRTIQLEGWFLTDDPNDLRKWVLPELSVEPFKSILVFASGKDRINPFGGSLHTNFKLTSESGFLAIVQPDGITLEHAFEDYPKQYADVSYGVGGEIASIQAITPESEASILSFESPTIDTDWTLPTFDSDSWTSATASAGFWSAPLDYSEHVATELPPFNGDLLIKIPFAVPPGATLSSLNARHDDAFRAWINGHLVAAANLSDTVPPVPIKPHEGDAVLTLESFELSSHRHLVNQSGSDGVIATWDPSSSSAESLVDLSGRGHHATLRGPTLTPNSEFGQVLRFDGEDDLVILDSHMDFDLADFSVSAWVHVVEGENFSNRLVSRDTVTEPNRKLFTLRTSYRNGERPAFQIFQRGPEMLLTVESDLPLKTGWHQIVGVREAGVALRIYVDGEHPGRHSRLHDGAHRH